MQVVFYNVKYYFRACRFCFRQVKPGNYRKLQYRRDLRSADGKLCIKASNVIITFIASATAVLKHHNNYLLLCFQSQYSRGTK